MGKSPATAQEEEEHGHDHHVHEHQHDNHDHAGQIDQLQKEISADVTDAAISVLHKELGETDPQEALNILGSQIDTADAAEKTREQRVMGALSYLEQHGQYEKSLDQIENGTDQQAKVALFTVYRGCVVDLLGGVCASAFPANWKTTGFNPEHIEQATAILTEQNKALADPSGLRSLLPTMPTPVQEKLLNFLTGKSQLARTFVEAERKNMIEQTKTYGPQLMRQYTEDLHAKQQGSLPSKGAILQKLGDPSNRKRLALVGGVILGGVAARHGLRKIGKTIKNRFTGNTETETKTSASSTTEGGFFAKGRGSLAKLLGISGGAYILYKLVKKYRPELDLAGLFGDKDAEKDDKSTENGGSSEKSATQQREDAEQKIEKSPVYSEQADTVAEAVNMYFLELGGNADVLGDGQAEKLNHGKGGIAVAMLEGQGPVSEILSVDGYQRMIESVAKGPVEKAREAMKGRGTQRLQNVHHSLESYAASQQGVVSSALMTGVASLVGGVIPSGEESLTAAQEMKVLCRKQLNVLTWLHEAHRTLQQECTPEDIEKGFLSRRLVSSDTDSAVRFLEQKGALYVRPAEGVLEQAQANTDIHQEFRRDLESLQQNPEQNKQKLQKMCEAYIEDVEDYGARTWASKRLSGLHEFFSLDITETEHLLEATGYTPLAEELTRGAKSIQAKIKENHPVTAEDYQNLIDAHSRYTAFLNEFSAQRLVVTEEMDEQGRKKLSLLDKGRYAGIVYGNDVMGAANSLGHGAFSLVFGENRREGAAQIIGGYVALDRYTYPWRKALNGMGTKGVPLLRPLNRIMNKFSPTDYVLKKSLTELSKLSAASGNATLRNIGLRGMTMFRYGGPDAETKLIRDYLLGRIDTKTASALATKKALGEAGDMASLLFNKKVFDLDDARIFVKYADNPSIRKMIVTERISVLGMKKTAIVSLAESATATRVLKQLKELDGLINAVSSPAHRTALRGMMATVTDLSKAKHILNNRSKLSYVLDAFSLANTGVRYRQRGASFGRLLDEIDDLSKIDDLLVRMKDMNHSIIVGSQTLRGLNISYRSVLARGVEYSAEMVAAMKLRMKDLVAQLKIFAVKNSPYASKIQKMIRELERLYHVEGTEFASQIRRITHRFPSLALPLGRCAKYAGIGIGGISALVGTVIAVQARKEAEYLDQVNPEMAKRAREYGMEQLGLGVAGTALIFIPGPGWVILGGGLFLSGLQRGSEAIYETERQYKRSTLELMQEGKNFIIQQLIHHACGQTGIDRGAKERFARFWGGGTDFDFHAHNSTQLALEAYFRLSYAEQDESGVGWITTLCPADQQKYIQQYNISPGDFEDIKKRIEQQVNSSMGYVSAKLGTTQMTEKVREHHTVEVQSPYAVVRTAKIPYHRDGETKQMLNIIPALKSKLGSGDAFGRLRGMLAESVYATVSESSPEDVKTQLHTREQELNQDADYKKKLETLYRNDRALLARMSVQIESFFQEYGSDDPLYRDLVKHAQQLRAFVNLKVMRDGRDPASALQKAGYTLNPVDMRALLVAGNTDGVGLDAPLTETGMSDIQIKESLQLSGIPIQDILFDIATQVLGYRIANTPQNLMMVFSEVKAREHGLYIPADGKTVCIYNERDPKDMSVSLRGRGTQGKRDVLEFSDRVQQAIQENDLIETGGTAEVELNRLYGKRYMEILHEKTRTLAVADYPLKRIAMSGKEQRGKRFQLSLPDIGRCIQLGYTDMGMYRFMLDDQNKVRLQGPSGKKEPLRDVITREPSLHPLKETYLRIFGKKEEV